MKGKPKKSPREKDLTARYLAGGLDEDRIEQQERFGDKSKHFQKRKTERTALLRRIAARAAERTPRGPGVLVFDLDGTLMDNRPRVVAILRELAEEWRVRHPEAAA